MARVTNEWVVVDVKNQKIKNNNKKKTPANAEARARPGPACSPAAYARGGRGPSWWLSLRWVQTGRAGRAAGWPSSCPLGGALSELSEKRMFGAVQGFREWGPGLRRQHPTGSACGQTRKNRGSVGPRNISEGCLVSLAGKHTRLFPKISWKGLRLIGRRISHSRVIRSRGGPRSEACLTRS